MEEQISEIEVYSIAAMVKLLHLIESKKVNLRIEFISCVLKSVYRIDSWEIKIDVLYDIDPMVIFTTQPSLIFRLNDVIF